MVNIFGIPLRMHWTFGLLLIYVPLMGMYQKLAPHQTTWMGLLVAATFISVILHEFGHALAARRYGIPTLDIILLPIGGVARLKYMPEKPSQEFIIAIAGPLVNVFIALLLGTWLFFFGLSDLPVAEPGDEMSLIGNYHFFIPALIFVNLMLVVFNLLPAFPMDGGRIFRALLSRKLGFYRATRIATFFGQVLAVLLFFYGLWEFSITTALIGVFIFFTASRENKYAQSKTLLDRHKVADLVRETFTPIQAGDTMSRPFRLLAENSERNFLVFNEQHKLTGTLPEWAVLLAANNNGLLNTVGEYAQDASGGISKEDSLKVVYEAMRQSGYHILPVYEDGVITGVIDREMLDRFLETKQVVI